MTTKRPASTRVLKSFRIAQYITVLVVDADPISLANISTLLTTYIWIQSYDRSKCCGCIEHCTGERSCD
ncbi:hypothetical protein PanWU01x14_010960 [Parasponia andersonii]|uniref:Uncharacterized protein n=1 Tax=Parasponia andersonii TaxID=3476 RepID=A0A2P5E1D6_PARAD|nr:hypothetical protein PanWU01x14_010960 [Parasponia andersonii]